MIKNLIFDLGQVLLLQERIEMYVYLAKIFSIPKEEALEFYFQYKRDLVTGRISSQDMLQVLSTKFKTHKSINQLMDEYRALYLDDYKGVNTELLNYVDKLKEKYSLYIFTNTVDVHDEEAQKLPIYKHFLRVFKSYTDHIIKPEVQSYQYVVNKIQAKPEECLFIDDLEENVEGAIKAGLMGLVYINFERLKKDFKDIGVEV